MSKKVAIWDIENEEERFVTKVVDVPKLMDWAGPLAWAPPGDVFSGGSLEEVGLRLCDGPEVPNAGRCSSATWCFSTLPRAWPRRLGPPPRLRCSIPLGGALADTAPPRHDSMARVAPRRLGVAGAGCRSEWLVWA